LEKNVEIDLERMTPYARDLVKLALKEQATHDAKLRKHEAAKAASAEAAALVKEAKAAPQPPGMTEIDRLTRDVERLDAAVDKAGVSRKVQVDGAGLRSYHPLVALLRQAQFRLKQATEARDRVLSMTGGNLFGRSL
jgi:hypothetical protein